MKKILALMLALTAVLSLAACSKPPQQPVETTVHEIYHEVPIETTRPAAAETEDDLYNGALQATVIIYESQHHCSRAALIENMEGRNDGYSKEQILYAVDHCDADWFENAAKSGSRILRSRVLDREKLVAELEDLGFTPEQAADGAEKALLKSGLYSTECAGLGKEGAVEYAQEYLESSDGRSYLAVVDKLERVGFTTEEAIYGADNCGADWKQEAIKYSKLTNRRIGYSGDSLIKYLESETIGFTHEEAVYAAEHFRDR